MVTVIMARNDIEKFVAGTLTQEGLIRLSDIFLTDTDMKSRFKKVNIELE